MLKLWLVTRADELEHIEVSDLDLMWGVGMEYRLEYATEWSAVVYRDNSCSVFFTGPPMAIEYKSLADALWDLKKGH